MERSPNRLTYDAASGNVYLIIRLSIAAESARRHYRSRMFLMVSSTSSLILRSLSICFCTFCSE